MTYENSSFPAPTSAAPHPRAKPGFGKRGAPDQRPAHPTDFDHLPRREASIAAYLDRLPEGADVSVKTLAKVLPDYGQCALRTALRRLSEAGHLRRITETYIGTAGSPQWVTRTYFSRTARNDTWWAALHAGNAPGNAPGDAPADVAIAQVGNSPEAHAGSAPHMPHMPQETGRPEHPAAAPSPSPSPSPSSSPALSLSLSPSSPRSAAYGLLAGLGRVEPRLTLSAADCAALEPFAADWLARGASTEQVLAALTAGLPAHVHHPARFALSRLTAKLPPVIQAPTPAPVAPATRPAGPRIMECTVCRVPGRPEALPGGICRDCRGETPPDQHSGQYAHRSSDHSSDHPGGYPTDRRTDQRTDRYADRRAEAPRTGDRPTGGRPASGHHPASRRLTPGRPDALGLPPVPPVPDPSALRSPDPQFPAPQLPAPGRLAPEQVRSRARRVRSAMRA
ncbi:MarR family transcriptional regulator [Streptomyces sp. A1-5]|nr:MarR family transcriptional regulator [Streptomyces sp. A1-5]